MGVEDTLLTLYMLLTEKSMLGNGMSRPHPVHTTLPVLGSGILKLVTVVL